MEKVLITGGTGLVGSYLARQLREKGYDVRILSRKKQPKEDKTLLYWDLEHDIIDQNAINKTDYIIHLAGHNISQGRWTHDRKKQLYRSRIDSAKLIFYKLNHDNNNLKAFISASAIGCYGSVTSDTIFTEHYPYGDDFLAHVCEDWEYMASKFETIGVRSVKIRTGVVLADNSKFISRFAQPIKIGIGAPLGTGKQYIPWVHIHDLCNIYIKAIEDSKMRGAYNAVAPQFITNEEFTKIVAHRLHKPLWLPRIPSFIIKLIFGEQSTIILNGSRISPSKIIEAGYDFKYRHLNETLKELKI